MSTSLASSPSTSASFQLHPIILSLPTDEPDERARLHGFLSVPLHAKGVIFFVHGAGSSSQSPRNQQIARLLFQQGFASVLVDLLTHAEEFGDNVDHHLRFDIPFLTQRMRFILNKVKASHPELQHLPIGLLGASTGAATAIEIAAAPEQEISCVVSRGGRPDLASPHSLHNLRVPCLLIVGSKDADVLQLNREAFEKMTSLSEDRKQIHIVPGATHLFEEGDTLMTAAQAASNWLLLWMCVNAAMESSIKSALLHSHDQALKL